MKMSPALYADLAADIQTVANITRPAGLLHEPSLAEMWQLFHRVRFDRMSPPNHPAYLRLTRFLPRWEGDRGGNAHWLNRFYVTEGLNDSHIATALRRIARTFAKES